MGWTIHQSGTYGTLSEFTAHSLKMHINSLKLVIIAKAPKWNACVFNENLHTCIDLPCKDSQKIVSGNFISNDQDSQGQVALIAKTTGKTMTIQKHNCFEYLVLEKIDPQKNIDAEKISELWIASDIKLPSQIARIYCRRFGIPEQTGILKSN